MPPVHDAPLERLIQERHPDPEWATLLELAKGTGWKSQAGRIDAAAFNCWPSQGYVRHAFECKRTKGDFRRELDNPGKRKWVEEAFNMTWFVTPHGLVDKSEIPEKWGLLVATKNGDKLRRVVQATHRAVGPLREDLALSAMRAMAQKLARSSLSVTLDNQEITSEQLDKIVTERSIREHERLVKEIADNRRESTRLDYARKELLAPFVVLAQATGMDNWNSRRQIETGDIPITVDQVHKWVAAVGRETNRKLLQQLESAHSSLGDLIRHAKSLDNPSP